MRLLYIHQYFCFPEQSNGTRSYDLATSFVKRGIDVCVISSDTQNIQRKERWQVFERDGIKFYMLNCPYNNSMSFGQRIKSFLKFMWFATVKTLQIHCDCVLATSTPLTIAVPALIRKWIKRTPFIFEVRDVWPEVPIKMGFIKNRLAIKLLYWFEKLVYKNSFAIVPLSSGMNRSIKERYPNTKSFVIPNISEINRFAKVEQKVHIPFEIKDKKIVLYAGTFGIVNGLKYVVNLAAETSKLDNNVVYLLFGSGKEKDKVIEYAKEKGVLDKTVYICNPVSKQDLPYLYSIASVGSSFVIDCPVLWDNSANKFFDTLAAGRPVLINHEGWQAETIRKNDIGFVLPPKVTEKVAKQFVSYMNDSVRLGKQGENAINLAKKEYCLEVAVDRYLLILNKIRK